MAHEELWQQLEGLDRGQTAQRAKCQYLQEPDRFAILLLDKEYIVEPAAKRIYYEQADSESIEAGFLEQLCILVYLINAKDIPPAGKLVQANSLPGGQFFFRGIHELPTAKLIESFGRNPQKLLEAGERFGGEKCEFGDASIQLYILPRLPLTMIVWGQCDEFDARASILFDETAAVHMPFDALLAGVNLTVNLVITCSDTTC